MTDSTQTDTTYWLSQQFKITFGAYEDRLIVTANRGEHGPVNLLLTRRMVMIVLHELLSKLADLTGLSKTPAQHWQEVLQMAHQQAMQAKQDADQAAEPSVADTPPTLADVSQAAAASVAPPPELYLATELVIQLEDKQLTMAFKGLPMPKAMVTASAHEPVLAISLQPEHVHQLIQLLITKSQEAQWHLPLSLPWLENPQSQPTSLGTLIH
ncbi:hypothetical protein CR159_19765 [Pollutimonas subterranea]|uniref:Uncharacterized protein n=1 Tax=Pollutimonas subterranea TaxID=2045210 RepID=A0A2N4TZG8_9BURK|nr:hypothetical protein [Pollutimonas subterranea]PLC48160.1 hypothetical protein CR159_19765 [Pollutimonas subterranea]